MSKSFLILFGSVTGKAESIAELLHRDAESKGFETRLHCMADQDQVSQSQTKSKETKCFNFGRTKHALFCRGVKIFV